MLWSLARWYVFKSFVSEIFFDYV